VGGGTQCGTDIHSLGTLRGRLGLALGDNLLFVTGGWAFGHVGAYDVLDPQQGSKMRFGWTVGGGIERRLQGALSLKLEYLYSDFGKSEHFQNTGFTPENISLDTHVVRLGLNFALGGRERSARDSLK